MYQPTVNDRVRWREHEGWVYTITEEYFTLEVATKLKDYKLRLSGPAYDAWSFE